MGCTSEKHVSCDSEVESLFRETLNSYTAITKKSMKDLLKEFQRIPVSTDKEDVTEQTYNSKNYENFLSKFLSKGSDYEELQKCVPQTFEELFESHLRDKPDYNFLLLYIGFLDEGNKFGKVREIYSLTDNDPESFTYEEFAVFVDDYLKEALISITTRLNNYIQGLENKTILPEQRMATDNFKSEAAKLLEFYSNQDNHNRVKNDILKELRRIINMSDKKFEDVKGIKLNDSDIKKLNSVYPEFFNVVELRHHYWLRFNFYKKEN